MFDYEEYRRRYLPNKIKILFVAESPPPLKSSEDIRFFYYEKTKKYDWLFRGIMEVLYPQLFQKYLEAKKKKNYQAMFSYKREMLKKFCSDGYYLIDLFDKPVRKVSKKDMIEATKRLLCKLNSFINKDINKENLMSKKTPIILIKRNVYGISGVLKRNGYNVINKEPIPFPCCGQQERFKIIFQKYIKIIRSFYL